MNFLGFNQLGLTDELVEKIIISNEDAHLIKLGLQHVSVGIRYHDKNIFRAMTLTALERKLS